MDRELNKSCKELESRASLYREVLPMCEQIMRARIGFTELLVFHDAVLKKAEKDNLSREAAAYRVMEDIENYEKIGGLKNEMSRLVMQRYFIDQMCAKRNKVMIALATLQSHGVTDKEILNIHEFLNAARFQYSKTAMDHTQEQTVE